MAADGSASFTDDQVEELCETFKTVSLLNLWFTYTPSLLLIELELSSKTCVISENDKTNKMVIATHAAAFAT